MTTPNDASDGETFKATTVESGIRQTAPKRWEVRVFAGRHPDTGAPRTVSRSTTKGIRDARRIKTQIAAEVARGEHGVRSGTVGSLLKRLDHRRQARPRRTDSCGLPPEDRLRHPPGARIDLAREADGAGS